MKKDHNALRMFTALVLIAALVIPFGRMTAWADSHSCGNSCTCAYQEYVSRATRLSEQGYYATSYGYFWDWDQDGVKELLVVYCHDRNGSNFSSWRMPEYEFGAYDMENGRVRVVAEDVQTGILDAGGSYGWVGIVTRNGTPYIMVYARESETGVPVQGNTYFNQRLILTVYDWKTGKTAEKVVFEVQNDNITVTDDGRRIEQLEFDRWLNQYPEIQMIVSGGDVEITYSKMHSSLSSLKSEVVSGCNGCSNGSCQNGGSGNTAQSGGYNSNSSSGNSSGSFQNARVGSLITFGSYEQDGYTYNGREPITWLVLEKQSDRILVISESALDSQLYHYRNESVTWRTCSIRSWLNNDFYTEAFTSSERERILATRVDGNSDTDSLFFLSLDEVKRYFSGSSSRICYATDYAVQHGAYVNDSTGGSWWLLRSPGSGGNTTVMSVNSTGEIDYGSRVEGRRGTIRPAMWININ